MRLPNEDDGLIALLILLTIAFVAWIVYLTVSELVM